VRLDGVGLVDPVLTELVGDVARRDVLSLACGQGQDARLLARLGATVTGVDVSAAMLHYARQHEAAALRARNLVRVQTRLMSLERTRHFETHQTWFEERNQVDKIKPRTHNWFEERNGLGGGGGI
jgi:SAM-dependent methyltransferase